MDYKENKTLHMYGHIHVILTISTDVYNHYQPYNKGQDCNDH